MKIFGLTRPGFSTLDMRDGEVRACVRKPPTTVYVPKLSIWADTLGTAGSVQVARGVCYDQALNLIGYGSDVTFNPGLPAQWFDLPFPDPGLRVDGHDLYWGVHSGPTDQTIRMFTAAGTTTGAIHVFGDNYFDGPGSSFGDGAAPTFDAFDLCLYVTYVSDWYPPSESEDYYASLAFNDAQSLLATGPTGVAYASDVGWYAENVDADTGSFALVRSDGPLAALVGKRVQITVDLSGQQASVVVFVKRALADLVEDISVTRRSFFALGALASQQLPGIVTVLS